MNFRERAAISAMAAILTNPDYTYRPPSNEVAKRAWAYAQALEDAKPAAEDARKPSSPALPALMARAWSEEAVGMGYSGVSDALDELRRRDAMSKPRDPGEEAIQLLRDIASTAACGNSEPDVMADALDTIIGKAQGWLRTAYSERPNHQAFD